MYKETNISQEKLQLPDPSILKAYEKIKPGFTDSILEELYRETMHQRSIVQSELTLKKQDLENKMKLSHRGQLFGFSLSVLGLLISTVLAFYDKTTVASVIGGTTIVSLVSIFVLGRLIEKKRPNTPHNKY